MKKKVEDHEWGRQKLGKDKYESLLKGIPAYEKMLEKIKEPLDERVSTWSRYCILLILFAKSDFSYRLLIQNRFNGLSNL